MATLVLTAAGSVLGGPIGGAIGAAIGNQIDRAVLAPARRGPRLGDLSMQTSSYGSAIPRLFGTMRVAGTVIWATDLREDVHRSGSKAGRTTTYSYTASVAVALSARPILRVGRIWADGKPLRGADGGWRAGVTFRLHTGAEDQGTDPLIASAQGIDATPAHRGIAYAVLENLELADFGNRVPSLSFEVVADEGPVGMAAIADELSGGAIVDGGGQAPALSGYAAAGDSARGAIEALAAAAPLPLRDDGRRLTTDPGEPAALPADALGTAPEGKRAPSRHRERRGAAALPDEVALTYYEPARDWQAGLQRARRDGVGGRALRLELPAAVPADLAKGLAEAALSRAWARREAVTVHLPWSFAQVRAGGRVRLDGRAWRVSRWTLEAMALTLELEPDGAPPAAAPAAAGAAIDADPGPAGATVLRVVDLPALGDADGAGPRLYAAAAGTGPGWRRAALSLSLDDGASWVPAGRTALPATLGTARGALPPGPAELLDARGAVTVDLAHDGMALTGADWPALLAGANLALIGDELIQFGRAEPVAPARWRLSRLLRGRRGTDGAIASHAAGEPFLLIEAATLAPLDVGLAAIGAVARVTALAPGDRDPAAASAPVIGRAARPPAPVHLSARRLADGTLRLAWVPRRGWAWLDGAEPPFEATYRVTLAAPGGAPRALLLDAPTYDYPFADQARDGVAGLVDLTVAQVGPAGASWPPAAARLAA